MFQIAKYNYNVIVYVCTSMLSYDKKRIYILDCIINNWFIMVQYPTLYNFIYIKMLYYFHHVVNLNGVDAFEYAYLKCEW